MRTTTWYVASKPDSRQGLVIEEGSGRNVAVTYETADAPLVAAAPDMLAVCKEIANDSKCDLVNSERRIRLYAAIAKAEGNQ